MKKTLCIVLSLFLLIGCWMGSAETQISNIASYSAQELTDGSYSVSFSADSIEEGSLCAVFYDYILFDAAQVEALAEGDSLLWGDTVLSVESVFFEEDFVYLNSDSFDGEPLTLIKYSEELYAAVEWEETTEEGEEVYGYLLTEVGEASLPLSETVLLSIHCTDDEEEAAESSVSEEELIAALQELNEEDIAESEVTLTLENGSVTGIAIEYCLAEETEIETAQEDATETAE